MSISKTPHLDYGFASFVNYSNYENAADGNRVARRGKRLYEFGMTMVAMAANAGVIAAAFEKIPWHDMVAVGGISGVTLAIFRGFAGERALEESFSADVMDACAAYQVELAEDHDEPLPQWVSEHEERNGLSVPYDPQYLAFADTIA